MIDLTNKTTDEVNEVLIKYQSFFNDLPKISEIINLVYTIHLAVECINEKYKSLDKDLKTWCVLLIKNIYKLVDSEADINDEINKFVEYHILNYKKYIDSIIQYTNEYDRDHSFLSKYIKIIKRA